MKKLNDKVTIHTDLYEEGILDNISDTAMEIFDEIHLMADTHIGANVPVGFVAEVKGKVVPSIVGVDIGCGMTSDTFYTDELNEDIFHAINNAMKDGVSDSTYTLIGETIMDNLKMPISEGERKHYLSQIGTLGGGNHFVELGRSSNDSNKYMVTVHSGSRKFGLEVCKYYESLMDFDVESYKKARAEIVTKLKSEGRESEISSALEDIKREDFTLKYLEGKLYRDYMNDMRVATEYAELNRLSILTKIMYEILDTPVDISMGFDMINVPHNTIGTDNIVRKGATSAYKDELVIIPINMRDGIIIGKGNGKEGFLNSAPHGAGRLLSRTAAREQLDVGTFEKDVEEVFSFNNREAILDEAPRAYRSIDDIVNNIENVDIIDIFKPIFSHKGE